MIALTLTKIKFMSKGILFMILLIFFYFLFMEPALQKFTDGATTIVQSQEKNVQPDPSVPGRSFNYDVISRYLFQIRVM